MGSVTMSGERLATLENSVENIKDDVTELKQDAKARQETDLKVAESLAKLTAIQEQNQDLKPRMRAVEQKQWLWGGGLALLMFIAPFVTKFFFG